MIFNFFLNRLQVQKTHYTFFIGKHQTCLTLDVVKKGRQPVVTDKTETSNVTVWNFIIYYLILKYA